MGEYVTRGLKNVDNTSLMQLTESPFIAFYKNFQ